MVEKIISGGQTGADMSALDVALRNDFPHGGWRQKGRKSVYGPIPARYLLTETPLPRNLQQAEWNVRDSDGTVVFTLSHSTTGGSLKTIQFARSLNKPCLHVSRSGPDYSDPALRLQQFAMEHRIRTINVAGSRESKEPGIYSSVSQILEDAFFWSKTHPGMLGGPGEGRDLLYLDLHRHAPPALDTSNHQAAIIVLTASGRAGADPSVSAFTSTHRTVLRAATRDSRRHRDTSSYGRLCFRQNAATLCPLCSRSRCTTARSLAHLSF